MPLKARLYVYKKKPLIYIGDTIPSISKYSDNLVIVIINR